MRMIKSASAFITHSAVQKARRANDLEIAIPVVLVCTRSKGPMTFGPLRALQLMHSFWRRRWCERSLGHMALIRHHPELL
jgi:hypothetical protein